MEILSTVFIGGAVFFYAAHVIKNKIRDIRDGRLCRCSCEGCNGSCRKNSSVR